MRIEVDASVPLISEVVEMWKLCAPVLDAEVNSIADVIILEQDGRYFVERTTFINSFSKETERDKASALREALLSQNWKFLDAFDPEFLPWYCRECEQNYHQDQWVQSVALEEDGWVDSIRGRCPKGHERMLAD